MFSQNNKQLTVLNNFEFKYEVKKKIKIIVIRHVEHTIRHVTYLVKRYTYIGSYITYRIVCNIVGIINELPQPAQCILSVLSRIV
jgi:hypothetical protein